MHLYHTNHRKSRHKPREDTILAINFYVRLGSAVGCNFQKLPANVYMAKADLIGHVYDFNCAANMFEIASAGCPQRLYDI